MMNNEELYRRKSQLLMQDLLRTINIEIMLQYLKPNERKALYYILNEDISLDKLECHDISELADYYDSNYKDKACEFDISSLANQFSKLKILNYEYINKFPCAIYLDLKDKFQKRIFLYSKILNNNIYSTFLYFDFKELKDYYFSYEKALTENLFSTLDKNNTYYNLIFLQGIMTEIKDNIIALNAANISLINSVLLGEIYYMMLKLYDEKQAFIQKRITEAFTDYVIWATTDIEKKKDKIIEKNRAEGLVYKEKLGAYEDKIKLLTKMNNESLINKLYEDLRSKELEISDLRDMLMKKTESEEKKIEALNSKIYNITIEKENLLNKITELEIQNARLQVKILEIEKENSINSTSEIIEYLERYTDKLYELFGANKEQNSQVKAMDATDIISTTQSSYRIGYAVLSKSTIEIATPNGRYPINNIPDQSLIAEGQFVRVDSNNNFINSYNYYTAYDIQFHMYPDCRFGVIQTANEKYYIDFGNGNKPALSVNKDEMILQQGQIVLADSQGNIKIQFNSAN